VVVHAANIQDRDGAKIQLSLIRDKFLRLGLIWTAGGYAGKPLQLVNELRLNNPLTLEIVKRPAEMKGFQVLPRRWVVERTFA